MGSSTITEALTIEELIVEIEEVSNLMAELTLDVLALDQSWIEHPAKSFKWNKYANVVDYRLKQTERKLKDVMAAKYIEFREMHIESGEKFTEGLLANEVAVDSEVKKIQDDILYLGYINNLMISAKKAVDDYRRALENLCSLYMAQYFAGNNDNPVLAELGASKMSEMEEASLSTNNRLRNIRSKQQEIA